MIIRKWLAALTPAALALICVSADRAQAGSFFGPSCYGADYAYQYPNRSHNVFGCGPCSQCTARHPIFKHRWLRKNKGVQAESASVQAMPPVEYMTTPVAQTPYLPNAVHTTSILPAPVAPAPVVQPRLAPAPAASARIEPIPAPLPAGPPTAAPPVVNSSSKPPF